MEKQQARILSEKIYLSIQHAFMKDYVERAVLRAEVQEEIQIELETEPDTTESKSAFSDGLCLRRFTPVSCGCVESLMGRYLQRKDVIKAIEHILDDDELVFDKLYQLLNNLKA